MDKPWDEMTDEDRKTAYEDAYHLAEFANETIQKLEGMLDDLCEAWLKFAVKQELTSDQMLGEVERFVDWYEGEETNK